MTARKELAEHLAATIDIVAYSYPPDNPEVPSIVMTPRDPYQIPRSFGKGGTPAQIGTMIDLQIAVQRTSIEDGFDEIERLRAEISASLGSFLGSNRETARWESLGGIGTTKVADVEVLTGTIPVMIVTPGP